MGQYEEREYYKLKVMAALGDHVGEQKAIGMAAFVEKIFGRPCDDPYNDPAARRLRKIIDSLQKEGKEICSRVHREGGGYFLSAAASQYLKNIEKLEKAGLKKLAKAARMQRIGLPWLLNQLVLEMQGVET